MSTAPSTASSSPSGNENPSNGGGLKSSPGSSDDEIFQFDVNEKVFCYHGKLIYQARCLKREIRDNVPQYFVHYHGWNKNWDEWVVEDRIRAFTNENINLYEKCRAQNPLKSVGKRTSNKLNSISMPTSSSNLAQISMTGSTDITQQQQQQMTINNNNITIKRKIDTPASSIDEDIIKEEKTPTTSIKKRKRRTTQNENAAKPYGFVYNHGRELPSLPKKLKDILANDYHQVIRNQKIPKISIPSSSIKTVQDVLDDYLKDRIKKELKNESTVAESFLRTLIKFYSGTSECYKVHYRKSSFIEFCQGLKVYFNSILETKLLYPIEQNLFSISSDETSLLMGGDNNLDTTYQSSINSTTKQVSKIKSTTSNNNNNTPTKLEPCAIYSPIYLLRMLTKLDECFCHFKYGETFFQILDILFKDFHEYLLLNLDNYFGKQNIEYVDVGDFQLIEELFNNNNSQS